MLFFDKINNRHAEKLRFSCVLIFFKCVLKYSMQIHIYFVFVMISSQHDIWNIKVNFYLVCVSIYVASGFDFKMLQTVLILIFALSSLSVSNANFTLAAFFTSHMVLQVGKIVCVDLKFAISIINHEF